VTVQLRDVINLKNSCSSKP